VNILWRRKSWIKPGLTLDEPRVNPVFVTASPQGLQQISPACNFEEKCLSIGKSLDVSYNCLLAIQEISKYIGPVMITLIERWYGIAIFTIIFVIVIVTHWNVRDLLLYQNLFESMTVDICSLRYPTWFALITQLKYLGLKQRKEVKMLVLNVWFGAHLQEMG
jgi:hypothetical protein